jgi:hypothetical protein
MMTINELLSELRKAPLDTLVIFDFCHCVPTKVGSWRGVYAHPALGWVATGYSGGGPSSCGVMPKVADLIAELEKAIDGREYGGWKGGEFSYSGNEPLHIDNSGESTNTELVGVEIDDWLVVLHTKRRG